MDTHIIEERLVQLTASQRGNLRHEPVRSRD